MNESKRLLYGLIGYPIGHSQSPALFRAYAPQREYADYELFPIEDIRVLPQVIKRYYPNGLNVTTPYKEEVLQLFQDLTLSPEVERLRATNVLAFDYEHWDRELTSLPPCRAYNTDVYGFRESLSPRLSPHHKQALILGTGGAARAVALALEQLGYGGCYTFVSRDREQAVRVLQGFMLGDTPPIISYEQVIDLLESHQIIINATPLGLTDNTAPPIPYERLSAGHLCYDLVYKNEKTPFLQQASQYGARCLNGAEMLRLQAEASWAIWLGLQVP